ncbi:hypothetical protein MMC07_002556 [Pseudocyphellaria aurata]|nr:hypothetical protein [Pseudocyphellaria aurata]
MKASDPIVISSDDEDNQTKTSLDRKLRRDCVRHGDIVKTLRQRSKSPSSPIHPHLSPDRRIVRSQSAGNPRPQPDIYVSMKRAMSAPRPICTPGAATKSPLAKEEDPNTRRHESTGLNLIEDPLVRSRSHFSNDTSASVTRTCGEVSKDSRSTKAQCCTSTTESPSRDFHTSSQPTSTPTETFNSSLSNSRVVPRPPCLNPPPEPSYIPRPPCLNPPPEPSYIPRPPCLNPTRRSSFIDPFPHEPYLKDSYLATGKAATPRQYTNSYPQQHPGVKVPRYLIDRPKQGIQPLVPKRKADADVENAPKRMKNEVSIATHRQISSPARSKFSNSSENFHPNSAPSIGLQNPRPPRNRAWTSVMLVDFAETLRDSFDFDAFATKHGKAVKDIRDTFEMVVSKPIFEHSSRGMARAKMQTFNQKLKEYVAWMKRGGRDVHGELTTSPWKLSGIARAKEAESNAKGADDSTATNQKREHPTKPAAVPIKSKASETTPRGRPRALKAPGDPLVYKDGIYQ